MSTKVFIKPEDIHVPGIPAHCFGDPECPSGFVTMWENEGLLYWSKEDADQYDDRDYGRYVQHAGARDHSH